MISSNKLTAKRIVMRRLFRQDTDTIINCYKEYDKLYYNPVNYDFVCNVMLCGEIWGAFKDDKLIACCYFFPVESEFFRNSSTFSFLSDFIVEPEKYMYMGYIGTAFNCMCEEDRQFFTKEFFSSSGLYSAFLNIVQMQTFRRGLKYILHSVPVKLGWDTEPIFSCGYSMIKLRGLDRLVVHYIFVKAVFPCENIYYTKAESETETAEICNTKAVSALLESGYCCVDIIKGKSNDVLMFKKLVAD